MIQIVSLSKSVCDDLFNAYLVESGSFAIHFMKDDWSKLILNMWNDYSAHKDAMDAIMAESITRFCAECIVVIDKALKFGILQLNCTHPLSMMTSLEERVVFILVFHFVFHNHSGSSFLHFLHSGSLSLHRVDRCHHWLFSL